jgi:single-strand DNA-binding protein
VATNRRWKDKQSGEWKEETDWTNVVLWQSENLAQYLTKGKQVYVEGRIQTRSYEDKDGKKVYATEVVAEDVILLGGQGGGGGRTGGDEFSQPAVSGPRGQRSAPAQAPSQGDTYGGITDDDVPF